MCVLLAQKYQVYCFVELKES